MDAGERSTMGVVSTPSQSSSSRPERVGVLGALEAEVAPLWAAPGANPRTRSGPLHRLGVPAVELVRGETLLLVARSGVGKVAAARAAAALVAEGVDGLLIVGTCGGLTPRTQVGTLVHADSAAQWDLAVRDGRESEADPTWRARWQSVVDGPTGRMLSADRPAVRWIDRLRRARAMEGLCVADMETAAAAAVAARAGLPWAALRAVSDTVGLGRRASFAANVAEQAGRAAESVPSWIASWRRPE